MVLGKGAMMYAHAQLHVCMQFNHRRFLEQCMPLRWELQAQHSGYRLSSHVIECYTLIPYNLLNATTQAGTADKVRAEKEGPIAVLLLERCCIGRDRPSTR